MKTLRLFYPFNETVLTNPGSIKLVAKGFGNGTAYLYIYRDKGKPREIAYPTVYYRNHDYDRIMYWLESARADKKEDA